MRSQRSNAEQIRYHPTDRDSAGDSLIQGELSFIASIKPPLSLRSMSLCKRMCAFFELQPEPETRNLEMKVFSLVPLSYSPLPPTSLPLSNQERKTKVLKASGGEHMTQDLLKIEKGVREVSPQNVVVFSAVSAVCFYLHETLQDLFPLKTGSHTHTHSFIHDLLSIPPVHSPWQ